MNGTVSEWIEKADSDYRVCARELAVREGASPDAICFHAQQCIEKLMKALLAHHRTKPPLTHNLTHLAELVAPLDPTVSWPVEELRFLTRVGAGFRYPGESADREDATKAMAICTRLREALLKLIDEGNS